SDADLSDEADCSTKGISRRKLAQPGWPAGRSPEVWPKNGPSGRTCQAVRPPVTILNPACSPEETDPPLMTLAPDALLRRLFDAGLAASLPSAALLAPHMPAPPKGRLLVLGAGKAGATMAAAVEELTAGWPMRPEGLVIVPYGHGLETRHIRVVEAAHPVPDEAGRRASAALIDLARGLGPDDLLLALISGGGSALAAAPVA